MKVEVEGVEEAGRRTDRDPILLHHQAPTPQLACELQNFVAERIGGYKRPRWIEVLAELPKTATGKLQRFKLREQQRRTKINPKL